MLRTTSLRLFSVMAAVVFAAGCAGIQAKSYIMTKERVGIEYQGGNAGYVSGRPQFVEPEKKTRRVYVLELTKPVAESEVRKVKEETITQAQVPVEEVSAHQQEPGPLVISSSSSKNPAVTYTAPLVPDESTAPAEAAAAAPTGPAEAVSYTVLKDDTLQKISKKFYDSYGKWMKIYDANKDKIKNPNFVKPGTVLTIPAADK